VVAAVPWCRDERLSRRNVETFTYSVARLAWQLMGNAHGSPLGMALFAGFTGLWLLFSYHGLVYFRNQAAMAFSTLSSPGMKTGSKRAKRSPQERLHRSGIFSGNSSSSFITETLDLNTRIWTKE